MRTGEVVCLDSRRPTALADAAIAEAAAVELPPRLGECIVHGTVEASVRRRRLLAWGASVAALGALGAAAACIGRGDPLALACIDFVIDEESHAVMTSSSAGEAALPDAVRRLGLDPAPQLGRVRYIGNCLFQGSLVHHMIASTPLGKVTILAMPERATNAPRSAGARGLHAEIVPVAGGSMALVGESTRALERIREMAFAGTRRVKPGAPA